MITCVRVSLVRCIAHLCNANFRQGVTLAPVGVVGHKHHGALIVNMQPKLDPKSLM